MHKIIFLAGLACLSCGFYADKYEEGIRMPAPHQTEFTFPGYANLIWLQELVKNDVKPTTTNIMVVNKKTERLDSLHALIWVFRSQQETFRTLVFLKDLKFKNSVTDEPHATDSLKFESNQALNSQYGHVYLISASPSTKNRLNGFYEGEFKTFLNNKLTNTGDLTAVVDYQGKVRVLFDDAEISAMDGTVSSDSLFAFTIRRPDGTSIDAANTAVIPNHDSTALILQTPIANAADVDSISIQINKVR